MRPPKMGFFKMLLNPAGYKATATALSRDYHFAKETCQGAPVREILATVVAQRLSSGSQEREYYEGYVDQFGQPQCLRDAALLVILAEKTNRYSSPSENFISQLRNKLTDFFYHEYPEGLRNDF